jgi:nucleotide-binding universal stress UspA family protein
MFSRILVGIDFSPSSREALGCAAGLAKELHLPLVAIHVVETARPPFYAAYAPLGDPGWFRDVEPRIHAKLEEWLAPYPAARTLVASGSPGESLIAEADPTTLLVVGEVGHSALEHLLFGSTATRAPAPCSSCGAAARGRRLRIRGDRRARCGP